MKLLAEIVADHGPVMFHQSGSCCDGSSPMCYPLGEFILGDHDDGLHNLTTRPTGRRLSNPVGRFIRQ